METTTDANSFDSATNSYDFDFTHSEIGKRQRKRVYHWLEKINFFKIPKKVFEINCGTGYDAEQFFLKGHEVTATDGSPKMIDYSKATKNKSIQFYTLDFQQIKDDDNFKKSEVLFSNFGGLNCLNQESLASFFKNVSRIQKTGDLFIGVFMAKHCLMEDGYHLLKRKWQKMGRRNTNQGLEVKVNEIAVNTYYHDPLEVIQLLGQEYKIHFKRAVAFFLPPSYLEPFFKQNLWLLKALNFLERIFGRLSFLAAQSDHYIIIAEKK